MTVTDADFQCTELQNLGYDAYVDTDTGLIVVRLSVKSAIFLQAVTIASHGPAL